MITEGQIFLAIIQVLPIILVWVRLESRLSRLEGQFSMFCSMTQKTISAVEKRRGAKEGSENYG